MPCNQKLYNYIRAEIKAFQDETEEGEGRGKRERRRG
jgi:hypothetical protein